MLRFCYRAICAPVSADEPHGTRLSCTVPIRGEASNPLWTRPDLLTGLSRCVRRFPRLGISLYNGAKPTARHGEVSGWSDEGSPVGGARETQFFPEGEEKRLSPLAPEISGSSPEDQSSDPIYRRKETAFPCVGDISEHACSSDGVRDGSGTHRPAVHEVFLWFRRPLDDRTGQGPTDRPTVNRRHDGSDGEHAKLARLRRPQRSADRSASPKRPVGAALGRPAKAAPSRDHRASFAHCRRDVSQRTDGRTTASSGPRPTRKP